MISNNPVHYDLSYAVSHHTAGIVMGTLKEQIKTLRIKMGWIQEELAQRVDVSLSTVQRWESGKVIPSRPAQKELARLFRKFRIDSG